MKNILPIIVLLMFSSCETEEQKIKKAEDIVKKFVSNLPFDNYSILSSIYPDFSDIETYWKLNTIDIISSNLNEDGKIAIVGSSGRHQILFELESLNNKYLITNSKGLSSDYDSNLYKFCKRIGCIGTSEYDKDISKICKKKKHEFESLLDILKTRIENRTKIENQTLSKSFGMVSGDVTIKNYSRFTIPGSTYEIYVKYLNSKGEVVFTSNESLSNFKSIPYNQSKTIHVFENNSSGFRKVDVQLKLTSTNFLEKVIAENAEGNRCSYSENL